MKRGYQKRIHRGISLFLSILLIVSAVPAMAFAEAVGGTEPAEAVEGSQPAEEEVSGQEETPSATDEPVADTEAALPAQEEAVQDAVPARLEGTPEPVWGLTRVLSPGYRDTVADENVDISIQCVGGASSALYALNVPQGGNGNHDGTLELVGSTTLDGEGKGSILFPASQYPAGPVTLRIVTTRTDNTTDTCYLQLTNAAGVSLLMGLGNAPENPVTAGMDVVFEDDFNTMPQISVDGVTEDGSFAYASRKIDEARGGMFGWAAFEDFGGAYDPFSIVDDELMCLTTTYYPDSYFNTNYWKQRVTTGYLSSENQAGGGFRTQGGANQYFECRMYLGPNPGMWPAFWLLTAEGYAQNPNPADRHDELDILEGYMGTPESYSIAWHQWNYDTGLGGGKWVATDHLSMGFHTFAVYITKQTTYYYFDNQQVASHKTLPESWEQGNYFIINAAVSDHYGVDERGNPADPMADFGTPLGFTRYGDESKTYIDWVRVYEDSDSAVRFETQDQSVSAQPGGLVSLPVYRNGAASARSGVYEVTFPGEGWKVYDGSGGEAAVSGAQIPFTAGSAVDTLQFLVPNDYEAMDGVLTITPKDEMGTVFPALTVTLAAPDPDGEIIRVDHSNYKHSSGGGNWGSHDLSKYDPAYFQWSENSGWWTDSWGWMYTACKNDSTQWVDFTFTGNAVYLYGTLLGEGTDFDVYLDDVYQETVNTYRAVGDLGNQLLFEKENLAEETHTLRVRTKGSVVGSYTDAQGNLKPYDRVFVKLEGFAYRQKTDPGKPVFSLATAALYVNAGDTAEVRISRNGAAATKQGTYHIEAPEGWTVLSGETIQVGRFTDTIQLKVPEEYEGIVDRILITPDYDGATGGALTVSVRGPGPKDSGNQGEEVRTVDNATYPYKNKDGGNGGNWYDFDNASQKAKYFTFSKEGSWWHDSWAYIYMTNAAEAGFEMTFSFEGTGAAILGGVTAKTAKYDVYLDGAYHTTVDPDGTGMTDGDGIRNQKLWSVSGLEADTHTVTIKTIVNTGDRREIIIDGFRYDYQKSAKEKWIEVSGSTYPYVNTGGGASGNWKDFDKDSQAVVYFDPAPAGGWWHDNWGWIYTACKNDASQTLDFTFSGTAIKLYGTKMYEGTDFEIYLDDVYQATVDTYQAEDSSKEALLFELDGLAAAAHTLQLRTKGETGADVDRRFIMIDKFEYFYVPNSGARATFTAAEPYLRLVPGEVAEIKILRNESAQTLSGTYAAVLPAGWAVVSGSTFEAGNAQDILRVQVPADYAQGNTKLVFVPKVDEKAVGNIEVYAAAATTPADIVSLITPEYRANIRDNTQVEFIIPGGYAKANAWTLYAPDAEHTDLQGYAVNLTPQAITLDAAGRGSFSFDASKLPAGPVTVRIIAEKANGIRKSEHNFFAFYNVSLGARAWSTGLAGTPVPEQIADMGMELFFSDDFTDAELSISKDGTDAQGNKTDYISHKPDYGDYGQAKFEDYESGNNPFSQVGNYLKITTKYAPGQEDTWNRDYYTGFLASVDRQGEGIRTHGYVNQYFECRFFVDANPSLWPAFWTLSNQDVMGGEMPCDELDVIEGYMNWSDGYSVAYHAWGDRHPQGAKTDQLGGGTNVSTENMYGLPGNITMGFHTYGMLVEEDVTSYYFDNVLVYQHPTLIYSWTEGNFFMINNALSAHTFPWGYGFERYGSESNMYVDWVRVYEQPVDESIPRFETDMRVRDVKPGDTVTVAVARNEAAAALSGTYEIDLPVGWTVESGAAFQAGSSKDTLVLKITEDAVVYKNDICITPVANGTRYGAVGFTALLEMPFYVQTLPIADAQGNWQVIVRLVNQAQATVAGGTVAVASPYYAAGDYSFDAIPAGESVDVVIPGSKLSYLGSTQYTFTVKRADGYECEVTRPLTNLTAVRNNEAAPVTIDGVVNEDEWAGAMNITLGADAATSYSASRPWGGEEDISAAGRLKWDDENLYFSVVVKDDVHVMEAGSIGDSWGSDSLQFSIDVNRVPGFGGSHVRLIAAASSVNQALGGLAVEDKGPLAANPSTENCVVRRDETAKTTTYEIALKWSELLPGELFPPQAGTTDIGFAFLVNDNDGGSGGRVGWLSYMGGIGYGKNAAEFGDLVLTDSTEIGMDPSLKQNQNAPKGLSAAAPTAAGASDGKIINTNSFMEYKRAGGRAYIPCTQGEVTGLVSGSYLVRYKETDSRNASPDTIVVVGEPGKTDQTAPTGLKAHAPSAPDMEDGRISGVNTAMEYRQENQSTYTQCQDLDIKNLAAGTYYVRYAGTAKKNPSPDTVLIVGSPSDAGPKEPAEAPTGLTAADVSQAGAADGKITGVTAAMEYRHADDLHWTAVTGTEISGLAQGSYHVRFAETDTHQASSYTVVTIGVAEPRPTPTPTPMPTPTPEPPIGDLQIDTVTVSSKGGSITVTVTGPEKAGAQVAVFDADGKQIAAATTGGDGKAVLSLPANTKSTAQTYIVKVKAAGAADWSSVTAIVTVKPALPFTDVEASKWYFEDVTYMWENGLMYGITAQTFAPESTLTRAMLVTILGRAAGVDVQEYTGKSGFTDVSEKAYYAAYAKWAAQAGIFHGIGNQKFSPGGKATREQVALVLTRYAAYLKKTLPQTVPAKHFTDIGKQSREAQEAIGALTLAGIIQGRSSTRFDPKGNVTRAEVAALVHRFAEAVK